MVGRAGQSIQQLTNDELKLIFEVVKEGDSQGAARALLPGRNRHTVVRAYNVAVEFSRRALNSIDDAITEQIAEASKYSTTPHYVQRLFLTWRAWTHGEQKFDPQPRHHDENNPGPQSDFISHVLHKPQLDHQQDLLAVLQQLHDAVHTPALQFEAQPVDFGLEDLLPAGDIAPERIVPLGYITPGGGFSGADPRAAVYGQVHGPADVEVVVVGGIPSRVRFQWEEEPVWDAAQQHLEGDLLLESVDNWRDALVAECRARGELNSEVKARAEEIFGAPVTETSPLGEARLTLALVWLVRQELTRRALGLGISDLWDRVKQQGGEMSDPNTNTYLMEGLSGDAELKYLLRKLIGDLEGGSKAGAAADAHRQVEATTLEARRAAKEHLLRHRLPGKCRWCPC